MENEFMKPHFNINSEHDSFDDDPLANLDNPDNGETVEKMIGPNNL